MDSFQKICETLTLLKKHDVPVMIHSVLTRENIMYIDEVANFILENGITRWKIYKVFKKIILQKNT